MQEQLRKLVIEMVLATDMKSHFAIQGHFQTKVNHNPAGSLKSTPSQSLHHPGTNPVSRGPSTISGADSTQLPHITHSPSNSTLVLNPHTSVCSAGLPPAAAVASGTSSSSNNGSAPMVIPAVEAKEQQHLLLQPDGTLRVGSNPIVLPSVPERFDSGSRRLSLDCNAAPGVVQHSRLSLDCHRPPGLGIWAAAPASLQSFPSGSSREGSREALPAMQSHSSFLMKSYRHSASSRRQTPAPEEDQETISLYLQVGVGGSCSYLRFKECHGRGGPMPMLPRNAAARSRLLRSMCSHPIYQLPRYNLSSMSLAEGSTGYYR